MTDAPVIEVRDLTKRYGDVTAVDGVSFEVGQGEVFGMLGPNGAGKTTTVECIEGLRRPDSGHIRVLDMTVGPDTQRIKARIGVQLQTTALYPRLTVREVLDLFGSFFPQAVSPDSLIELVGLEEKRDTLCQDLSGGQQQRLSVALALVNDPELAFLDEPTTGLDPQARRGLWDVIEDMQQQGKTVFLTTHSMEEAERLCDRVAVIDHGRIIALDQPSALIRQHFRERAIEFEAGSAPAQETLQALPGVTRVLVEDSRITLFTADVPVTMAALMDLAEARALAFADLHVRRATLEDVFLKLTGRRIRE